MKCPACNGTGLVYNALGDFEEDCGYCHGKGNVAEPHTNEDWFCGLSTEEKAKWIFRLTYKCYWCGREYEKTKEYNTKECPFQKCMQDSKDFVQWLKEKHHE